MGERNKNPDPTGAKVLFYEGYKGQEEPRAVILGGKTLNITEIIERKRHIGKDADESFETFLCRLENGSKIQIKVRDFDRWEIKFID